MLKKLLGIAPKLEQDGSYSPSKLALKLATSDTSDYKKQDYTPYQGKNNKIIVICTEQKNMTMQNGKKFSTGNHPVEALVPMLHLQDAGFEFEIATPTGKPVVFEMWAFPEKDQAVKGLFKKYQSAFENPKPLSDVLEQLQSAPDDIAAVFVPGGHGAMLGLPQDEQLGEILRWANDNNRYTISLCHGPGAFLATMLNEQDFLYSGYNMAVFPDSVDQQTPMIGYLPGKMPWGLSEKIAGLGVTLMNTKSDDTVCIDRKLITGASPLAADALGQLAANTLLSATR